MQKYYKLFFCCALIFNEIFFIFALAAFKPFYSDAQQICTNRSVVWLKGGVKQKQHMERKIPSTFTSTNVFHKLNFRVCYSQSTLSQIHQTTQTDKCQPNTAPWTILLSERNVQMFSHENQVSQAKMWNWNTSNALMFLWNTTVNMDFKKFCACFFWFKK